MQHADNTLKNVQDGLKEGGMLLGNGIGDTITGAILSFTDPILLVPVVIDKVSGGPYWFNINNPELADFDRVRLSAFGRLFVGIGRILHGVATISVTLSPIKSETRKCFTSLDSNGAHKAPCENLPCRNYNTRVASESDTEAPISPDDTSDTEEVEQIATTIDSARSTYAGISAVFSDSEQAERQRSEQNPSSSSDVNNPVSMNVRIVRTTDRPVSSYPKFLKALADYEQTEMQEQSSSCSSSEGKSSCE